MAQSPTSCFYGLSRSCFQGLSRSTYGLRSAVRDAADQLRTASQVLWAPDLFERRTFETVEGGM